VWRRGGVMHSTLDFCMAKKVVTRFKIRRPIFLKQWRDFRGLTQDQLAERAEMSIGNISLLERGLQNYSQPGLERLADALGCEPAHLLIVDPTKSSSMWSIWEGASEAERAQIQAVAIALTKKSA
jgi:transcriptional regulator with XRE-family HTH domain